MLDGRMYYVDGAVRSAGNDLQNVVADDCRCLKLERSSLPDTVVLCCGDIGGLNTLLKVSIQQFVVEMYRRKVPEFWSRVLMATSTGLTFIPHHQYYQLVSK